LKPSETPRASRDARPSAPKKFYFAVKKPVLRTSLARGLPAQIGSIGGPAGALKEDSAMRVRKTNPSRRSFIAAGLASGGALALSSRRANSEGAQAAIRVGGNMTTLVNIMSVEPENQQRLIATLKEGTETFFSKMPGFISSSVLAGKNGRQVINYAQWRSAADIEAFRQNPNFGPYFQRIAALAKSEAIACDVASVRAA
jgi:heme-degrading monooxygenase HmoA